MARVRRLVCFFVLAIGVFALGASAASASTFFVNGASGNDTHSCTTPAEACKTIGAAIFKAEAVEDTIDMDVFHPPRQDWLDKTDAYLRK